MCKGEILALQWTLLSDVILRLIMSLHFHPALFQILQWRIEIESVKAKVQLRLNIYKGISLNFLNSNISFQNVLCHHVKFLLLIADLSSMVHLSVPAKWWCSSCIISPATPLRELPDDGWMGREKTCMPHHSNCTISRYTCLALLWHLDQILWLNHQIWCTAGFLSDDDVSVQQLYHFPSYTTEEAAQWWMDG